MAKYIIQKYTGWGFSLRKLNNKKHHWEYYDTDKLLWDGGLNASLMHFMLQEGHEFFLISEEEALIIILARKWNNLTMRP